MLLEAAAHSLCWPAQMEGCEGHLFEEDHCCVAASLQLAKQLVIITWDRFLEKGPNACFFKILLYSRV